MKKIASRGQILVIFAVFILSRIVAGRAGLHFNTSSLSAYWQWLDIETLNNNLWRGIWYDHSQPPAFNLFLGIVLKTGGSKSGFLFAFILKLISLLNGLILFSIINKITRVRFLSLAITVTYIISPATIVSENELFYTTSVSFLLLVSVYYLIRLNESNRGSYAYAVIFPLVLVSLTHSIFHFIWLTGIMAAILFYFRKRIFFTALLQIALAGLLVTGSWYVKNKLIFGKFTVSTWIGMNLARNVFHDNLVFDSGRIEAYEPFSRISAYRKFVDPRFENKYKGLNDRDLLRELKNDSFINEKEVSYIQVSDLYMKADLNNIRTHPAAYAKNVFQSSVIYFTPATVYSLTLGQTARIKYYDLFYSFNLTHFAQDKHQRRILLTLAAVPKILLYCFVFFYLVLYQYQSRTITPWELFIMFSIGYVFIISSLFEHYENMRFRFETEPLFLILAAAVFSRIYSRLQTSRSTKQ